MTEQEKLQQRRQFFAEIFPAITQGAGTGVLPNTCPCCGYATLEERCSWEICSICFWEDDGQDESEADQVWGGPNGDYSLTQARLETADLLAALQGDSHAKNVAKSLAGLELRRLQMMIDAYPATDKLSIRQQLEATAAAFDMMRGSV
jgi:hypothetical protein